jgi:Domain of unknown function (DUF4349)
MKKVLLFSVIFTLVFSCKNQSKPETATYLLAEEKSVMPQAPPSVEREMMSDSMSISANSATDKFENKKPPPSVSEPKKPKRKIIRTAQMRFKAAKTDNATYKVEKIAKQFGGYVTESQMNSSVVSEKDVVVSNDSVIHLAQYQLENTMVVRIPNEQLDTFLTEMSRIYLFLDHRRISADDVTLAYMSSQLKSKIREHAAQRIQNATDTKGKRLDDIVNAETAATQLHDEAIDQQTANAEKDFNIQYSVVNLNIYQDMDIVKTMKANPSLYAYGPSFFTRLKESVAYGWAMVLEIILGLVSIWYLFLIGGLGWLLYKKHGKTLNFQGKTAKA